MDWIEWFFWIQLWKYGKAFLQKKGKMWQIMKKGKRERERERVIPPHSLGCICMCVMYVCIQWCHLVQLDPAGWFVMCRSVSMYIKYSYLVSVDRIIIIHAVEALVVDYLFVCGLCLICSDLIWMFQSNIDFQTIKTYMMIMRIN